MNEVIFKVIGYKCPEIDLGNNETTFAAPGSIRLDLRIMAKRNAHYFDEVEEPVKNFGCYMFGQPDRWKGVVGIKVVDEKKGVADIDIYYDKFRTDEKKLPLIKELLKESLGNLKKSGFIDNFQEVKN